MEVGCLKTNKEEWKKLSLKEITERIDLHYKEDKKSLQWWSIQIARASNNFQMFSYMLCNGASNVEPLIYIYRVFFGSYSRCRVSNGVMPCVLGPTRFLLEILGKHFDQGWTSECCCVFDDLHLGSSWYSSRFIMYEWTHEFLGNNQSMGFPHTSEGYFPRLA